MTDRDTTLLLTFVALTSGRLPDPENLITRLQERYPVGAPPSLSSTSDNTCIFNFQGGKAAIGLIPAPIPWSSLEGPCSTAFWWPEAATVLKPHTHHVIVTLHTDEGTPLERHVWLTKFVAALLECTDAAGVYWGAGTVVHPPQMFCEQAANVTTADPITQLWIDHRCWPEGRSFRFATTGLAAFGILELEVDETTLDPNELYRFCRNVVEHLLHRGSTIKDGDTIGRSTTEKIKIRHAPSMWPREGTVMKLLLP